MTAAAIIADARTKVGDDYERIAWVLADALCIVCAKVSAGYVRMEPRDMVPVDPKPEAIE